MEELVDFRSWNLEADKAFARDDGLVALTAVDSCLAFHKSPALCVVPLFRQAQTLPVDGSSGDDREFPGGACSRL